MRRGGTLVSPREAVLDAVGGAHCARVYRGLARSEGASEQAIPLLAASIASSAPGDSLAGERALPEAREERSLTSGLSDGLKRVPRVQLFTGYQ